MCWPFDQSFDLEVQDVECVTVRWKVLRNALVTWCVAPWLAFGEWHRFVRAVLVVCQVVTICEVHYKCLESKTRPTWSIEIENDVKEEYLWDWGSFKKRLPSSMTGGCMKISRLAYGEFFGDCRSSLKGMNWIQKVAGTWKLQTTESDWLSGCGCIK